MNSDPQGPFPPDAALRIIADDLTGALDSAAPFASPLHPVTIGFSWSGSPAGPRVSISTDSRDLAVEASCARVAQVTRMLQSAARDDMLWFKKVDSVLRGHPIDETLSAFRAGGFSRLVFAPAYPGLGRITRSGQQFVVNPDDGKPQAVGPDLWAAFRAAGLAIATQPTAAIHAHAAIILDAATQEELSLSVQQWRAVLPRTTLWAGAGGLALALGGGQGQGAVFDDIGLIIVGTRHPVTQRQVEHARTLQGRQGLPGPEIFHPALHAASPEETASDLVAYCLSMDPRRLAGRSVLVVGGDTLATVLRAVAAEHLVCEGEAAPGVAVSRIAGGRWAGVSLLSKSGGFGTHDLLHRLAWAQRSSR